jgi:hypothetical protein
MQLVCPTHRSGSGRIAGESFVSDAESRQQFGSHLPHLRYVESLEGLPPSILTSVARIRPFEQAIRTSVPPGP